MDRPSQPSRRETPWQDDSSDWSRNQAGRTVRARSDAMNGVAALRERADRWSALAQEKGCMECDPTYDELKAERDQLASDIEAMREALNDAMQWFKDDSTVTDGNPVYDRMKSALSSHPGAAKAVEPTKYSRRGL